MKKLTLAVLFSSYIFGFSALAQTEVGIIVAPSATNFYTGNTSIENQYTFPVNFGLGLSHAYKRFTFSTGLLHFTQGMKFEVEERNENNLPTGETFDIIIRAKAIIVPLNIDYNFVSKTKTKLFAGVGLSTGYIYSQQLENTAFPNDWMTTDPNTTNPDPPQRFTDVQFFNDVYFGLNARVGIKHRLSDKFSLAIRPNLLLQLREELPEATYGWTNRMMSFSLDFGLYYTLEGK